VNTVLTLKSMILTPHKTFTLWRWACLRQ